MKFLAFAILIFISNTCLAQYIAGCYADRKGEFIVYHIKEKDKDSVIFFKVENGERAYAFVKDDNGRNVQLAKAGISIQDELVSKLKMGSVSFRDAKGGFTNYNVQYLDEYIGALTLDENYSRPEGIFCDLKSKSVITWANKGNQTDYFNITWRTGDNPKRKEVPFRSVNSIKDYYTNKFLFTANGEFMYIDGRLYNLKKNREVWKYLPVPQEGPLPAAISADEEFIAVSTGNGRVDILKLRSGKLVKTLPPLPTPRPGFKPWYITPASDMKTYTVIHRNHNMDTYACMVFEDGNSRDLVLGDER